MGVGKRYFLQRGFLPAEASAFKNITAEAIKDSRYITVMIETRMRFRREAISKGLTIREYWHSIREQYVKKGFADKQEELVLRGDSKRRNHARRLAFDFFNAYKDKYAIRDKTGKLVETPRKKVRVSKKPITGKHGIDQTIRKDQEEIKYLRFRLKFEKDDHMMSVYQNAIKNHQDRITRLKTQATYD